MVSAGTVRRSVPNGHAVCEQAPFEQVTVPCDGFTLRGMAQSDKDEM